MLDDSTVFSIFLIFTGAAVLAALVLFARRPLLVAFILLGGLAGCDPGTHTAQPPEEARTQPESSLTSESIRSGDVADALPDGAFEIEILATGVTITASKVSQQTIFYNLATQADFEVMDTGVPWGIVTLNIEAENLHTALVELLKQHPYQIIYEFDKPRQTDTLKRVVVGVPPAGQTQPAQALDTSVMPDTRDNGLSSGTTEVPLSLEDQVYLNLLLDPSAEVREEAAEDIEPVGIALDYLARIVTTDPSPEVRMAAAHTLGDSEALIAIDALTTALQDSDPEVLVEVIDELGYIGNRLTIPYLQPFLDHPDEDVRDAAETSMEQLE